MVVYSRKITFADGKFVFSYATGDGDSEEDLIKAAKQTAMDQQNDRLRELGRSETEPGAVIIETLTT